VAVCQNCGAEIAQGSALGLHFRNLPKPLDSSNVSITDLDFVIFHYRRGWFMTIEAKQFGARPSKSQQEIFDIISEFLTRVSGMIVTTMRGDRPIEYRGHHLVQFEKTTPDDSQWIRVDGVQITRNEWIVFLESGRLPMYATNGRRK
jgi:hypothetical protein